MTTTFNPARLTLARQCRGLKKQQLAELADISIRSITNYESGKLAPAPQGLSLLAAALNFPIEFFYGQSLEVPSPSAVNFRAMTKMTASQRDSALGTGALAVLFSEWLQENFKLPSVDLPDLSDQTDPEAAANRLRELWGIDQRKSITNMVHLLESKGVRVFSLSIESKYVDAFSMWHRGVPYVFLNGMKSSERSRFDAAHELAHLVLHPAHGSKGQDVEREANAFASAFLMPRDTVLAAGTRGASLPQIVRLKSKWNVSVAAMARRLHDVGMLTEWQYRTVSIEIGRRGYSTNEPQEGPREVSLILSKVFRSLRAKGKPRRLITDTLKISASDLNDMVFGLALAVKETNVGPRVHTAFVGASAPSSPPKLTVHVGGKTNGRQG